MCEMAITVFTPTFNRAHTLGQLYNSLCNQSFNNFEWLLVDDGSEDETKQIVDEWQKEDKIKIKYLYQENQGRFAAYNHGVDHATGELLVIADSDDYLTNDALGILWEFWSGIGDKSGCTGVMAYAMFQDGELIGTEFPENVKFERSYVLYDKFRMKGDKCIIVKTEVGKKYKYTLFKNEKFTGDSIVFNDMCKNEGPMALLREKIYVKEYAEDGLTQNLLKHHLSSPNGMAMHYKNALEVEKYNFWSIYKHAVGYLCFSKIAGWEGRFKNGPKKAVLLLAYPVASILVHTRYKGGSISKV